MKEYNNTPQKEDTPNHRSKELSRLKKKPQKIVRKSLNGAFHPVSEDGISDTTTSKELADFSPVSEISSITQIVPGSDFNSAGLEEFAISDLTPVSKTSDSDCSSPMSQISELVPASLALSASSEASASSLHASSYKIAASYHNPGNVSMKQYNNCFEEVNILSNFLKRASNQVLYSDGVDQNSKKLLDALVKVILDDFHSLPEERNCYSGIVSTKFGIVFLCFLLWAFLVYVVFFGFRPDSSYGGLTPT